jgi:hypothetical protein
MLALNCVKAITRVRRRVQDANSIAFQDVEVLEAIDDALQPIYTTLRLAGRGDEMDRLAVPRSSMTEITSEVLEFRLPETVGEIRLIEGETSSTTKPVPLLHAQHLMEKESGRGFGSLNQPVWFFSRFGRPGEIQIRGRSIEFTNFNIWHARHWPPLHYGTATAGGANTLTFPAAPTGDLSLRDDVYIGMDVEITADPASPANVGALGRITDYVGATRVATFEANWPAVTSNQTTYALVVPLEPEHTDYMVEEAAFELFSQLGETEALQQMAMRLGHLRERFTVSVQHRQTQDGLRLWSGRRTRI